MSDITQESKLDPEQNGKSNELKLDYGKLPNTSQLRQLAARGIWFTLQEMEAMGKAALSRTEKDFQFRYLLEYALYAKKQDQEPEPYCGAAVVDRNPEEYPNLVERLRGVAAVDQVLKELVPKRTADTSQPSKSPTQSDTISIEQFQQMLRLVNTYLKHGQNADALTLSTQALAQAPDTVEALVLFGRSLGRVATTDDHFTQAIDSMKRAKEFLRSRSSEIRRLTTSLADDSPEKRIERRRELLSNHPEYLALQNEINELIARHGKFSQAKREPGKK